MNYLYFVQCWIKDYVHVSIIMERIPCATVTEAGGGGLDFDVDFAAVEGEADEPVNADERQGVDEGRE